MSNSSLLFILLPIIFTVLGIVVEILSSIIRIKKGVETSSFERKDGD